MIQIQKIGGLVLVHIHLYFKGWLLKCLDNLLLSLVVKEIGVLILSFIHSYRRNKLTPKRAEDLVFIHNNLRLLSRSTSAYNDEKTKMWDVGGDDFGSMEDVGILEFANLLLDEPELKFVFFNEDSNQST